MIRAMARILIIDDNTIVLETYCQMLERAGYEVVKATGGKEGTKLFRDNPTDLVITDILMPEKEGFETIIELRRDFPDVKIIAISGGAFLSPKDYLEIAKQFGAMRTLTKPIDQEELLEAVRKCLT